MPVRREVTGGGPSSPEVEMWHVKWRLDEVDAKLAKGAATFGEMRGSITTIEKAVQPKPVPVLRIVGIVVTCVALAGGWVWQLARYPDRVEFNETRDEQAQTLQGLDDGLDELRRQYVRTQADVEAIRTLLDRQEAALRELVNRRK